MFDRLRNLLGGSRSVSLSVEQRGDAGVSDSLVSAEARDLAHRLLTRVLRAAGADGRLDDIDAMDIADYRILVQLLPFRFYLYALASEVGRFEFEMMLRSQRPAGSVF